MLTSEVPLYTPAVSVCYPFLSKTGFPSRQFSRSFVLESLLPMYGERNLSQVALQASPWRQARPFLLHIPLIQGYLAHKKQPPLPRAAIGP